MNGEFSDGSHYDLVGDRISKRDFNIMLAFGSIKRGNPKAEVLDKYNLTEEEYDSKVESVLEKGF